MATQTALKRRADATARDKTFGHLISHFETLSSAKALARPSAELLDELKACYKKLGVQYEEIYSLAGEIRRLDTDETSKTWITNDLTPLEEKWKTQRTRYTEIYHSAVFEIEDALLERASKLSPQITPATDREGETGGKGVTLSEKFKPKTTLTLKLEPTEYSAWKRAFQGYFRASNLDSKPIVVQRQALELCIDADLIESLRANATITDTSPIFGQDESDPTSCMFVLNKEYERRHPEFEKLTTLLKCSQKKGEKHPQFMAKVRLTSRELGREPIPVPRLAAAVAITHTEGNDLQRKLYETAFKVLAEEEHLEKSGQPKKEDDYLFNQIEETGKIHDTITYQITQDHKANFTKPGRKNGNKNKGGGNGNNGNKGNNGGNSGGNKNNKNNSKPSFQDVLTSKCCSVCGSKKHKSSECDKKEKAECSKCNKKKSHLSYMCYAEEYKKHFANKNNGNKTSWLRLGIESESESDGASHEVTRSTTRDGPEIEVLCRQGLKGFKMRAQADTGTSMGVIPQAIAEENDLFIEKDKKVKLSLTCANGDQVKITGTTNLEVEYMGNETQTTFLVSPEVEEPLIDLNTLKDLQVIPRGFPHVVANTMKIVTTSQPTEMSADEISDSNAWLKAEIQKLIVKYQDSVFSKGYLKPMKGPPMKIQFRNNPTMKPFRATTCRAIAAHLAPGYEIAVDKMITKGIIEKVPDGEISEWCFRASVVPKSSGDPNDVRIVVDCSPMNPDLVRPVHTFPSPQEMIRLIKKGSRFYAVFDCTSGYWQIEVDPASRKYLTFLLPGKGRYQFCRAPMGLSVSSDEYNKRTDEHLSGIPGIKVVDDYCVSGATPQECLENVKALFERCKDRNITLSDKKVQCGNSVKFVGFLLENGDVKPHPDRTRAIREFPQPLDKTGVRSFLGLANQLGMFHSQLAMISSPLTELLRRNVDFQWLPEHTDAFNRTKDLLTSDVCLVEYDPTRETRLITDASKLYGMGYALVQKYYSRQNNAEEWRLVEANSRKQLPAETRYSVTDSEMNAAVWAMKKLAHYLTGHPGFELVTDHKPLVQIFDKVADDLANERQRRLKEKVDHLHFTTVWIPGRDNVAADSLSRYPWNNPEGDEEDDVERVKTCRLVISDNPCLPLSEVVLAANADVDYQSVMRMVTSGTHVKNIPPNHPAQLYKGVWSDLSVECNVIVFNERIVIPESLRSNVLDILHLSHPGVSKSREKARHFVYWPNIDRDIAQYVQKCKQCMSLLPAQQREPLQQITATSPFEKISMDLFSFASKNYLAIVDRFSGYLWCYKLTGQDTDTVLGHLKLLCKDHGFPKVVMSDNGPCFRSKFGEWVTSKGGTHVTSSPGYPQSNGLAENAVKRAKFLIEKYDGDWNQFENALSEHNRDPRADGLSPATLFFQRELRGSLPVLPERSDPSISAGESRRRDAAAKAKARYDEHANPLPPLQKNDKVVVYENDRWDVFGHISEVMPKRSYVVETENGTKMIRNRNRIRLDTSAVSGNEWPNLAEASEIVEKRRRDILSAKSAPPPSQSSGEETREKSLRRSKRIAEKHSSPDLQA